MKRFLKYTGVVLGVIVLLVVLLPILLVTFVNPNQLKPLIINQVKTSTGRELTIDGDLSWTIYPSLGVKIGHMELSNPPNFTQKTFAEIERATISVKLIPLLHHQIESDGITLDGMKLYLIKQANGKNNWEMGTASSHPVSESVSASSSTPTPAAFGLAVSNITVSNAAVSWQNEQTQQVFDITQFELQAKNIELLKPFPFKMSFQFTGRNPAVSGSILLTSNVTVDLADQLYTLNDLRLAAKDQQGEKHFDTAITGDVVTNLNRQTMTITNLTGHVANLTLTGAVDISKLLTQPYTVGHLLIQPFDAKEWLRATGQDAAALQTLKNVGGHVNFSAGTTLQSVNLQGDMSVEEIRASNVQVSSVKVRTQMTNGILTLAPMTAAFYQGTLQGETKIDLNHPVPQIRTDANLANVQIEPLMVDVAKRSKLTLAGTGNINLQVSTSGTDADAIIRNLNGTGHVSLTNGALKGIDIPYLIDNATSLLKHQAPTHANTNQTPFGSLTGSMNIHNGVVANNDLLLDTSLTQTQGHGQIDLVQQQINYQLETIWKQNPDITIPISISGNLSNPSMKVDASEVVRKMARERLEKVKSEIQEQGIGPGLRLRRREILNNLLNR